VRRIAREGGREGGSCFLRLLCMDAFSFGYSELPHLKEIISLVFRTSDARRQFQRNEENLKRKNPLQPRELVVHRSPQLLPLLLLPFPLPPLPFSKPPTPDDPPCALHLHAPSSLSPPSSSASVSSSSSPASRQQFRPSSSISSLRSILRRVSPRNNTIHTARLILTLYQSFLSECIWNYANAREFEGKEGKEGEGREGRRELSSLMCRSFFC